MSSILLMGAGTFKKPLTLLLDEAGLSGASAAYSCARKLRSSYGGSAIRVRRSSDNSEQDIGFVGTTLDTSSLTSFVGANNGFITKIYDQTGNGLDCIQSTAWAQPKIVSSGTINTLGGKPAMLFNGSSNYLTTGSNSSLLNFTSCTMSIVANGATSPSHGSASSFGTVVNEALTYDKGIYYVNGPGVYEFLNHQTTPGGQYHHVTRFGTAPDDLSNRINAVDSNQSISSSGGNSGFLANSRAIYIGNRGWLSSEWLSGSINEWVLWGSKLGSTPVSTAETDTNAFYAIY